MPDDQSLEEYNTNESLRAALRTTQRQLVKAKERNADLVAATIDAARDATFALGPIPPVSPPKADKRRKSPEVALWHLTDWQAFKHTPSYNFDVLTRRMELFCDKAETITAVQRADHPVKSCVIAFGGDMGEGLFNYPTQPFEIDATIFEQFVGVSHLEAKVIRRALAIYDTVEVIAEWGNHGRIGSKRDAVPRYDNIDRMTYELARQLLAGEKRLQWEEPGAEDIQHIEIGNYRALSIHGDEVGRNGYAAPPTMVNHVTRWKSGAHNWDFRDVYIGHYHNHREDSMPNGEGSIFWTGSTESENKYANVSMAASAVPSQRLHFIDPDRGRCTAQYKVWLE